MDFLIRPVVKDSCQDVQVGLGQFIFKEVTCYNDRIKKPVHLREVDKALSKFEMVFVDEVSQTCLT